MPAQPRVVRDLGIRLVLSPVFGTALPAAAGLVDPSRHSRAGLVGSYLFFACCAFLIWTGNRWLYLRLPRREDWLERPMRRISVLLCTIGLFTIPVAWFSLTTWQRVSADTSGLRPFALPTTILGIVTVVVIITHVYETVFLLEEWDSARLRAALLEQARLRTELAALSREVDPHFLFNSLHALAHLVEHGSSEALPFIEALGDSYRYLLSARGRPLVPLSEELRSLRRQELLSGIRTRGAVRVCVGGIGPEVASRLLIPPVTLSELLTNAVKHNRATPDAPLMVDVALEGDTLVVSNDSHPSVATASSGVGLGNLAERHRLATGLDVTWGVESGRFRVRIPLVEESKSVHGSTAPWANG